MQRDLLAAVPSDRLKVYAIWFNMFPTDSRAAWPADLLTDPRVIHFWDEGKVAGRWFGGHPDYGTFQDDGTLWDAYLLYGPEARWNDKPSHLVSWGYTIVGTREELKRNLTSVLERARPAGAPAGTASRP